MFDHNSIIQTKYVVQTRGSQRMYLSYLLDSVTFYLVTPSIAKCLNNNYDEIGHKRSWFPED